MTWTYNSSNVGSSALATVRFLIGDTSSGNQLVSDEEIVLGTTTYSDNYLAAAVVAEGIAGYYSRYADTTNEGLTVAASQRASAYLRLAHNLRLQAYKGATIYVGGRSIDEKDDRADDSDLVQPYFKRDMDDYTADSTGSS